MADNVVSNAGAGGATWATDDIAGVHYSIGKLAYGALDSVTIVSTSNGLPVQQQGTWNIATVTTVTTVTTVSTVTAVSDAQVQGKAAHDAVASGNPNLMGGYASAAAPADVSADADAVRAWYLRNGSQVANLAAGGTLITGDGANGLDVDVTRVSGTVTCDTELPAAAALADNTANPSVPGVGAYLMAFDGTDWDRVRLSGSLGSLNVAITNTPAVTVSGAVDTEMPAAAALSDTLGNPTAPAVGAWCILWDGTQGVRARGDTANGLDVDVTRVPADPFGLNADAASTTGSISAKLRHLAATGIAGATSLPAGTNNIGDVDLASAIPTGTNSIGRVNPEPQAANGLTIHRLLSAATTNAQSIKASAGQVYAIYAHNTNAAVRFLKIYNKASAPTVGTDTPVLTLPIPGNTAGAGFVLDTGGMGIAFATGIASATTTGVADTDTGAVAANEVVFNLLYK